MKKYLREIEVSGGLLMLIGVVLYRFAGLSAGYIACALGILLWLIVVVFKACHWNEYRRDNLQNIAIMLVAIVLLFGLMLFAR